MKCPNCGKNIPEGHMYCDDCGTEINIVPDFEPEVENEISDYIMEVPSSVIGQKTLKKLMDIDTVAYIRFASVYNNFADINDFMTELKKLKKEHDKNNKNKK